MKAIPSTLKDNNKETVVDYGRSTPCNTVNVIIGLVTIRHLFDDAIQKHKICLEDKTALTILASLFIYVALNRFAIRHNGITENNQIKSVTRLDKYTFV